MSKREDEYYNKISKVIGSYLLFADAPNLSYKTDLKITERQFFKYVIKQIDWENVNSVSASLKANIEIYIDIFAQKKNVSEKQLWYYVNKWSKFTNMTKYDTDEKNNETTDLSFLLLEIPDNYKAYISSRVIWRIIKVMSKDIYNIDE